MAHGLPVRGAAFALAIALAAPLHAQSRGETAGFIVRLGRDTVAVERFTRSDSRVEGVSVGRSPRVSLRRYAVDVGPFGEALRAEVVTLRPDAPDGAPLQRIVATFARDSVTVEIRRDTAVQVRRFPAPRGTMAFVAGIWGPYDLATMRWKTGRADSLSIPAYYVGTAGMSRVGVQRAPRDSVDLVTQADHDRYRARIDRHGRIRGTTPIDGTQRFSLERVNRVDPVALAARFLARDAAGQGLGTLSTRDTVRAAIGGAALWMDYGRPLKRGRVIFGGIVPWNGVWRTGANAATQFRTDRDLDVGGAVIPAGTYTLWTVPGPERWQLLVNRQTGQWGTEHDPARDMAPIVMRVTTLPQPVERFTISMTPEGSGGVLNLDWDTTRASLSFTVR